jgi:amino acid transporter
MFVTIGTALFGLFGKQATAKAAKAVGIGALAALVVIGIALFFVIHDHNVIKNHDAGVNAQVANSVVAADRDAGAKKEARDQDFGNSQAAVTAAVNNAVAAAPAEAKKPVGPASQSYYKELRRQQQLKKGKH